MNNLLTEHEYLIDRDNPDERYVTWYSALHKLESFKSVVDADWTNTCSSAGDWDGYVVQRINGRNYLIPISQENNYPCPGYTLYTGRLLASWIGEYNKDDAINILSDCMEVL